MELEQVALDELLLELEAMLRVCFEGVTERGDGHLSLNLPNGQKFVIECRQS